MSHPRRLGPFPNSNMGVREPRDMAEMPSFPELERMLNFLVEDNPEERTEVPVPGVTSLRNYFVDEKAKYFRQVLSNVVNTKKNFLQNCEGISKKIELMTRQIMFCAQNRERQLKLQLQKIALENITHWDQQASICQEALNLLRRCNCSYPGIPGPSSSSVSWNDDFTRQLQLLKAGEVEFDSTDCMDILRSLQGVGKIITHEDSDSGTSHFRSYTPKFVFGESGAQPGQFCRPWGVCSDATGRILVCDRSNHRIQIFNECGEFLLEFGKEGSRHGEFNRPSGIDVDDKCRIVVADKDNHRVQIFTFSGHFLLEFGSQGSEPGQFLYPWDVASNKNCEIGVSDSKNHRIQLFSAEGQLLTIFDAFRVGIENPRVALRFLDSPRGLAFRPDGGLLVTDFNNHKILLINHTFDEVITLGCEGTNKSQFFRPQGIACDKNGTFAVADCKNYRVQIFDPQGTFLTSFGTKGINPGQFDCPQGICFHPNKNIIVVDFNNNRVQVF